MLLVIVRIRNLLQMTADRCLRLVRLGPDDGVQSVASFADVGVTAEEIHRAGAEAEQLRHPRVVVVVLRKMAVGAILGRADAAGGVRKMRIERLAAVAFGGNGLLLRINPFAIRVLRADHDRARRTNHRHAVLLYRAVDAEHENVVAHDLRIVGREIAIGDAFEFIQRHALVRFHRQMTAETTGRPGGVTDLAIHRAVIVREIARAALLRLSARARRAPGLAVAPQRFRVSGLRIVVRRERDRSCRSSAEFPSARPATSSIAGKASFLPRLKRGPHGVLLVFSKSIWPPLPVVISVGRWSIVPWQSMHAIVVALRGSP